MMGNGEYVEVTAQDLAELDQYFPDLRSMKKGDRNAILKGNISKVKELLRGMLEQNFKGKPIEFDIKGNTIEATLYNTGIREVLEKINPSKAAMLGKTGEVFSKAKYLYSTGDKSGDPNVNRWNYFFVPLKLPGGNVGVRIAIRDIITPGQSQIYNWDIKKEATPPYEPVGQNLPGSGTSVASYMEAAFP